jgi:hypothetical protein
MLRTALSDPAGATEALPFITNRRLGRKILQESGNRSRARRPRSRAGRADAGGPDWKGNGE